MSQYSWDTCPEAVRRQVEGLVAGFRDILGYNLTGIYLHGSLAMGCFNPMRSDVDLLVVTREPMSLDSKRHCIELLLRVSGTHTPVEISFLAWDNLHPWRYPPPFDLHFSESWRERYQRDLETGAWTRWNDERRTDIDLAAHITHLRDRGIVLLGPPIEEVFPEVPRDDYLASILADHESARDEIEQNPVYGVLNMCRVYHYLREGRLSSKDEAGAWALKALPPEEHPVVEAALAAYREAPADGDVSPQAPAVFAVSMDRRIRDLLTTPVLETSRLILRSFALQDWPAVDAMLSDPQATRYMHFAHWTPDRRRQWFDWCISVTEEAGTDVIAWAITRKETGDVIGWFGIGSTSQPAVPGERSFGYLLSPAYWNQGYMTEALHAVLSYELGVRGTQRVSATCEIANTASFRVMEKAGMHREKTVYDANFEGNWAYRHHYFITRAEYRSE